MKDYRSSGICAVGVLTYGLPPAVLVVRDGWSWWALCFAVPVLFMLDGVRAFWPAPTPPPSAGTERED